MKYIQSLQNSRVKDWRKLLTRKERDKTGCYLVEGFHLVEEAIQSDALIDLIISEETELPHKWNYDSSTLTIVTAEIMKELSDTETPQGILAVCKVPKEETSIVGKQYLLLDAIQDPGNLGTMIRTADACGIDAVIVGNGSVDIYNPKVLRSAQGSHFHLPIIRGDLNEWINALKKQKIAIYGTSLQDGHNYKETSPSSTFALLMGNEGNGVNPDLLQHTTKNLYIPIMGRSESLNVAVATGILLYFLKG